MAGDYRIKGRNSPLPSLNIKVAVSNSSQETFVRVGGRGRE